MKKLKELILFLDRSLPYWELRVTTCYDDAVKDIKRELEREEYPTEWTTIPYFLSFQYAERLFVYVNDVKHEITLGKCKGTNREIKETHNLEKMIFAGEFDWYKPGL